MQGNILRFMIVALGALIFAAILQDVSAKGNVRFHCEADFLARCGKHEPYTGAGDRCMRKNKHYLSSNCRKALFDKGYKR